MTETPGVIEETTATLEETTITDYQVAKKLVQLKQSADSRGIEFSLSFAKLKKLLLCKKCYYTGKTFGEGLDARSVDRVDSSKGYIDSNVVACTVDINQKKTNLTTEEIFALAKFLKLHYEKGSPSPDRIKKKRSRKIAR